MPKHFLIGFLAIFLSYGLLSCDRPSCTNENPVFDSYGMEEEPYRKELVQVLDEEEGNVRFWLKSYQIKDGRESITVYIQNDHVCAQGMFFVEDWTGIEGIRETKGVGYRGAELKGFNYRIDPGYTLFFSSLEYIID